MRSDPGRRSWPAGTIAFHINADIAAAVLRYVRATGDAAFEREVALELLVETARLCRPPAGDPGPVPAQPPGRSPRGLLARLGQARRSAVEG